MTRKPGSAEAEIKYRALFELTTDGVSVYERKADSLRHRLVDCNDAYACMAGRPKAELFAAADIRKWQSAHTVEQDLGQLQECIEKSRPYEGSFSWVRPDGQENYVEYRAVPVPVGDSLFVFGIDRDVTARVVLEREKERLTGELIRSEKSAALGRVVAGVAHEINNPASALAADMMTLRTLVSRLSPGPVADKIGEVIARDTEAVRRISDIVAALKSSSPARAEAWRLVDISREIQAQLVILHKLYKDRITIRTDFADLPLVRAYAGEIGQAVANLLTNAMDAIAGNGVVSISTHKTRSGSIQIKVADTGSGISQAVVPYLFEPFFSTKGPDKGTGLGLFLTQEIARRHKGRVFVEKTGHGAGTTFVLEIAGEHA